MTFDPYVNGFGTGTAVQIPRCPACGCLPHDGGVASCPDVQEVEYDSYGAVRRIVKRDLRSHEPPRTGPDDADDSEKRTPLR